MPLILNEFRWAVDDTGHEHVPSASGDVSRDAIKMRTPKLRWFNPLDFKSLFMEFGALQQTSGACIDFADRFGLLRSPHLSAHADAMRTDLMTHPSAKFGETLEI